MAIEQRDKAQVARDVERVAGANLKELGDIRIDDVLEFIDRGIENMPSYMDLYRRWESQQWAVADLDFTRDRQDWEQATELERKATLWSHRNFFNGEERVTSTLAPFVWAAPTPEIEIFLSTQMVDEARHTVFFDRWWHEVPGTDAKDLEALMKEIRPEPNEGYDTLFYDRLPSVDFSSRIAQSAEERLTLLPVPGCGWSDLGTPKRVAETLMRTPDARSVQTNHPKASAYFSLAASHAQLQIAG